MATIIFLGDICETYGPPSPPKRDMQWKQKDKIKATYLLLPEWQRQARNAALLALVENI